MQNTHHCDTVIFDFDGTIADTLEEVRLVVNRLSIEHNFKSVSAEELSEMRKLTLSQILKTLGIKKLLLPVMLAKGTKQLRAKIYDIALIDGMKEVIDIVRGKAKTVGILTSNSKENVELFLEKNGMSGSFDFIKSSSKLSGKAKCLKQIMKQTQSDSSNTIYIGDEVRDIEACKKVKLPIISVTWGFNASEVLEKHSPEFLVDTTDQLTDCLEKVLN